MAAQKRSKKHSSNHTRAARRASSPNPDKALEPTASKPRSSPPAISKPHILAAHPSGITKKSKTKQLKRQQRIRHKKGIERAEHVIDKMEMKVGKSVGKEKKVKERKKGWEEVNVGGKKKKGNVFGALGGEEEKDGGEWESEEEMVDDGGDVMMPEGGGEVKNAVEPETIPLPAAMEDEAL